MLKICISSEETDEPGGLELINDYDRIASFTSDVKSDIILYFNGQNTDNYTKQLLGSIAEKIHKFGVKIGIVSDKIVNQQNLKIRFGGKEKQYSEVCEILTILRIIAVSLGIGSNNEILFYGMIAELNDLKILIETNDDLININKLIKKTNDLKIIKIGKTQAETTELITKSDGRLKIFIPINYVTSFMTIRNYDFTTMVDTLKNVDWICGNLQIDEGIESGLVYVIKDSRVIAVCLDDYDLKILKNKFSETNLDQLKCLSQESMSHSLYPERAKTSESIAMIIENLNQNLKLHSYGLESFQEEVDINVINANKLCNYFLTNNYRLLLKILVNLAVNENHILNTYLNKIGFHEEIFNIQDMVAIDSTKNELKNCALDCLRELDEFEYNKFYLLLQLRESDNKSKDKNDRTRINSLIDEIKNNVKCPEDVKSKIISLEKVDFKNKCIQVGNIFETQIEKSEDYMNLKNLISYLTNENVLLEIIRKLINNSVFDETIYENFKSKTTNLHNNKSYFNFMAYLAERSHGIKYFILHKGIENLSANSDQVNELDQLITKLSDPKYFSELQWKDLWNNNRFLMIINSNINQPVIAAKLQLLGCGTAVPDYVPKDIASKINATRIDNSDIVLPEFFQNIDELFDKFREIRAKNNIPPELSHILNKTITEATIEHKILYKFGIPDTLKWDGNIFTEPIDMYAIISIMDSINEWKQGLESKDNYISDYPTESAFDITFKFSKIKFKESFLKPRSQSLPMTVEYSQVFGNKQVIRNSRDFISLGKILERPVVSNDGTDPTVIQVLPYIIQKIKMWGCNALTADNFSLLSQNETKTELSSNNVSARKTPKFRSSVQTHQTSAQVSNVNKSIPLSRLDTIACLFNSVDNIVAQDLLNIMAKFPIALPLIIKKVYDTDKFTVITNWLTQQIFKWESKPGKIVENHLFLNKFKMIVALRVGDNEPGKSGKSTVLNQIFSQRNLFSCCGEPGGEMNKPVTLGGTAELVCLTQETASTALWENVLKEHYQSDKNEIILLVNLHGNALDHPDQLEYLKDIATSFILFIMPNNIENLETVYNSIQEKLGIDSESDRLQYLAIDPIDRDSYEDYLIIDTARLAADFNVVKVRNVVKSAVNNEISDLDTNLSTNINTLEFRHKIETDFSKNFTDFIKRNSCQTIKRQLISHKFEGKDSIAKAIENWKTNETLRKVIKLFCDVLTLEINSRLRSFLHIERELNIICSEECTSAREDYKKLVKKNEIFMTQNSGKDSSGNLKDRIDEALDKIDNISLGLEHFYREIGKLYEFSFRANPKNNNFKILARSYAELLLSGNAIELLDGDSGTLPGVWLTAISKQVNMLYPGLRVFVISIIGLQSSGKSTLLNALFASKFAVSVGRCTRGLFMRLLFLDENMKKEVERNFDAILLIDTEGLGAPEKQNDTQIERKDRILATFALGVSHLTIINVLGEYINSLTAILQIAMIAMSRLEKIDISPDILMVQHLTERNTDRLSEAKKNFCDALEHAIRIADIEDMDLGIRNSDCLKKLRKTILSNEMFCQFRPFKNGASANSPPSQEYHNDIIELYKTIFKLTKSSNISTEFKSWSALVKIFWDSVKDDNFLQFRDIREVKSHLENNERIASVKESIRDTFKYHSMKIKNSLKENAKKINLKEIDESIILKNFKKELSTIPYECTDQIICENCNNFSKNLKTLKDIIEGKPNELNTITTIDNYIIEIRDSYEKVITQKLSAEIFRNAESLDIFNSIEQKIKNKLNECPVIEDQMIHLIANNIWKELEREASYKVTKVSAGSLSNKIYEEVQSVYNNRTNFVNEIKTTKLITLAKCPAIDPKNLTFIQNMKKIFQFKPDHLQPQQVSDIEKQLQSLGEKILKIDNAEIYQEGMIAKLKANVDHMISSYSNNRNRKIEFLTAFKWKMHIYAINEFIVYMVSIQQKWDDDYNPVNLLKKKEELYSKFIGDKLKFGYGFYSNGMDCGHAIVDAIKERSIETLKTRIKLRIENESWTRTPTNIRLEFFSQLVDEIKNGQNDNALQYFTKPRETLNDWFRNKIINIAKREDMVKFSQFFITDKLNSVVDRILNLPTLELKQTFIGEFITSSTDLNSLTSLNIIDSSENESDLFIRGLLDSLKLDPNDILNKFPKINELIEDKFIKYTLGCVESCPICSAICWMPYNHDKDVGESKLHHACHQPIGFTGLAYKDNNRLALDSCHNQRHIKKWFINEQPMDFQQYIREMDYEKSWTFQRHDVKEINDLMYWFFLKLQSDLAHKHNAVPTDESKFGIYCGPDLSNSIEDIMIEVMNSLYN